MSNFTSVYTNSTNLNVSQNYPICMHGSDFGGVIGGLRWQSHRLSGCSYGGYIFTAQPRNTSNDTGYYLDVQANPCWGNTNVGQSDFCYSFTDGDPAPNGWTPTSWQLSSAAREAGANIRYLTAMWAGSTGGAFATWLELPWQPFSEDEITLELFYEPLVVDQATGLQPTRNAGKSSITLPRPQAGSANAAYDFPQNAYPRDMACTVVGGNVYYFLNFWNSTDIYYFVCRGGALSAGSGSGAISYMGKVTEGMPGGLQEIWSIDATTVYMEDAQKSGGKLERIALSFCCTGSDGAGHVASILYAVPDAGNSIELSATPPAPPALSDPIQVLLSSPGADSNFPAIQADGNESLSASIRTAWGAPWAEGQAPATVKNGLVMVLSWGTKWASTYPKCRITAIDLATCDGRLGQWFDVAPPAGDYNVYGVPDASCFVSVVQPGVEYADAPNVPQTGYAPLLVKGTFYQRSNRYGTDISEDVTTSTQLPSFRFIYDGSNPTAAGNMVDESWNEDQYYAAMHCWTLLGVVIAPPPIDPAGRVGTYIEVVFGNGKDKGTSVSIDASFSVSVGVGGDDDLTSATASFSHGHASTMSSSSSEFCSNGYGVTQYGGKVPGDPDPETLESNNVGIYFYSVPMMQRYTGAVEDWTGTAIGKMNISMLQMAGTDLTHVFFNRNNPGQAFMDIGPAGRQLAVAKNFPAGFVAWPESNSLDDWRKFCKTNVYTDYFAANTVVAPPVQAGGQGIDGVGTLPNTIAFETDQSHTTSSDYSMSVDAELDLEVLKFGGSCELSTSAETEWSNKSMFEINWGYQGKENMGTTYHVDPVFMFAKNSSANFLPAVSKGQRPWVLTWHVY